MQQKFVPSLAIAAALVAVAGCSSEDATFDPRQIGQAERQASTEFVPQKMRPLPTTLQSQFMPDNSGNLNPTPPNEEPIKTNLAPSKDVVRLSLREIIHRVTANNLAVKVSGYEPAIDESRITEAEARFDPEAFANIGYTADREPESRLNNPDSDQIAFGAGLRQLLPSGGQLEASWKPTHVNLQDNVDSRFSSRNGYWTSALQLQITQPLLQNFGNDVNEARIVINRYNERISVLDFRKDLEDVLEKTEETYWQLYQAQRTQAILESLLQRTLDTADIVSKRFGQDVTLEQISTSVSRVESARADLIRARQRVKDLSDQLKAFMNDPEFPIASEQLILPADEPLQVPVTFDFSETVKTALINRYDIAQQQLRIESASVSLKVAKNNELPQLNLTGTIGTIGGGQPGIDGPNSQGSSDVVGVDNRTFNQALNDNFDRADLNWSFGLEFTQKLGNREAKAIYRRAELQRQQAMTSYQDLIDKATLEVKKNTRDVETNWQAIAQTRSAKFAAGKALDTIQNLEAGGEALRPDFIERKLQRQQELANAEQAEAEAEAGYNVAICKLEQSKGTLLRYNNVILDQAMFKR